MNNEIEEMTVLKAVFDVLGMFFIFGIIFFILWVSTLWGKPFSVPIFVPLIGITIANYLMQLFTKRDFNKAFETSFYQVTAVTICLSMASS